MEIKNKQIYYYIAVSLASFSSGLLLGYFILKSPAGKPIEKEGLEIVLKEDQNRDKNIEQESGCTTYVDVSGAIINPGVYCMDSGSLIIDAVNKAGGFKKDSATRFISRKINMAQSLVNGQKIYFPYENELVCQIVPISAEGSKVVEEYNNVVTELPTTEPYGEESSTGTSSSSSCININSATKEQLITLNGVGESTATKIIEGRPYSKIEDLLNVSGIGEATLNKFKADICI